VKLYGQAVEDAEHQMNGAERGWDIIKAFPGRVKESLV